MTPRPDEAAALLAAAERDCVAFGILDRAPEAADEIVLFHAQQAAEKFIKAVLASRGVVFRRTHDLLELAWLAATAGASVPIDSALLIRLAPYAVEFRYLGALNPEVSRDEAGKLIEILREWAARSCEGPQRAEPA
jgi:HEPN domain-containing protein